MATETKYHLTIYFRDGSETREIVCGYFGVSAISDAYMIFAYEAPQEGREARPDILIHNDVIKYVLLDKVKENKVDNKD